MSHKIPKSGNRRKKTLPPDCRKQLFNTGAVGPIEEIQVSTERIVRVCGILYDLDLAQYKSGTIIPRVPKDPKVWYDQVVRPWLSRHPVLDKAEVRFTGSGLHVIPWFAKPVEIENDSDRERWAAIVQVVQAALPVDPQAPGITATTRAIGSTNSKNGARVVGLKRGEPVQIDEVLELYEAMCSSPFKTVLSILAGTDRVSPCPVCNEPGSALLALDYVGHCYKCGNIILDQLYDLVFRPIKHAAKKAERHGKKSR